MSWSRLRNPIAVTLSATIVTYACDALAATTDFPAAPPAEDVVVAIKVVAWLLVVSYAIISIASKALELEERWRNFRRRDRK